MSKLWYATFYKKAGDCRGTEKDGAKNEDWCVLCYKDGQFTNPGCTLEQMLIIVDDALKETGSSRLMRWLAKKQIPSLKRWKK